MLKLIRKSLYAFLLSSIYLTQTTCQSTPFQPAEPVPQIKKYQEKGYQVIHFTNGNRYRTRISLYEWAEENKDKIDAYYQKKLQDPNKMERALEIIDTNKDRTISDLEVNIAIFFLEEKLKNMLDEEIQENKEIKKQNPKNPNSQLNEILEEKNPQIITEKIKTYFDTTNNF